MEEDEEEMVVVAMMVEEDYAGEHYASLGNLANGSIEAAGMSGMWT